MMKQYRITVWEAGKKWCYRMGTNNIQRHRKQLNEQYNRYTVEEV